MTNEQKYWKLSDELRAIEANSGVFLVDANTDRENVPSDLEIDSAEYWDAMISCMTNAAGMRAEEAGLDINILLGRVVY